MVSPGLRKRKGRLSSASAAETAYNAVYNLYFSECTCELHKRGYVSTPLLCECSRQSIIYVLHSLWPGKTFNVTICESVLRGSKHCKMRISVLHNG